MAGQAQVKSGLDLFLRDEVTGEWLRIIGTGPLDFKYGEQKCKMKM